MDSGTFAVCPYNPQHRMPRQRLQYHIVKCEPNYPKLEICPYNATHRFPKEKIVGHVKHCPSKANIFPGGQPPKVVASITKPQPIQQKEYLPETDPNHEMWDD